MNYYLNSGGLHAYYTLAEHTNSMTYTPRHWAGSVDVNRKFIL